VYNLIILRTSTLNFIDTSLLLVAFEDKDLLTTGQGDRSINTARAAYKDKK